MKRMILVLACLGLTACNSGETEAASSSRVDEGKSIAEANCASCHAIDAGSDNPHPDAPAFRTLSEKYPVADLSEALAEGIMVGHPDMPEFTFSAEQADALIAFIETLQRGTSD